jgi:hypothetical protein
MARAEKNVRHFVGDYVSQDSVGAISLGGQLVDSVIEDVHLAGRLAFGACLSGTQGLIASRQLDGHVTGKNPQYEVDRSHT